MQSAQTVLHNEAELSAYLESAIVILAERAGHPRGTLATPDLLVDRDSPLVSKKSNPTNPAANVPVEPDVIVEKPSNQPVPGIDIPVANIQPEERVLPLIETNSLPILHRASDVVPSAGSREALIVTPDDFISVPLVVDVWMTRCAPNVPRFKYTQPKYFAGGFVVWSILHHYFPRDAQLSAFHEPQTRLEFAEIWSQVDLILQKHSLTRVPVEVISAVMAHRQVGQAILLMTLYEGLTNLKLPNPIPILHNPCRGVRGKACDKWHFLQETTSNTLRRPASFAQLLRKMFTTNQEMAFCRAHRRLQPPRVNRHFESRVDFGSGREAELSKLQRLVQRPQGERCYLFHEDRQNLIKKHREREKSHASSTPRLMLLQPPFFTTGPLVKCPRAPVTAQ